MSDETTFRHAVDNLRESLGAAAVEFWADIRTWVADLRPIYKASLIAAGYVAWDVAVQLLRRGMTIATTRLSTVLGSIEYSLTAFDFFMMVIYFQMLVVILLLGTMRRINKLESKIGDMASEQTRLDGGHVQEPSPSEPWLSRFIMSRAFLLGNAGFFVGYLFSGPEQGVVLALTGLWAGFLFPSGE